jgi:uncharacterized protein YecT (DUF1311 family)
MKRQPCSAIGVVSLVGLEGKFKMVLLKQAFVGLAALLSVSILTPVNTHVQTLDPSPAQMTAFRGCLGNARSQQESQACGTRIYTICNQASGYPDSTLAMSECNMMQSNAWDKVLNEVWVTTLRGLEPSARTKLRAAQRLWINSRKADCEVLYEAYIGGSMRNPVYADCMAQTTMTRYFWLKDLDGLP